MTSALLTYCTGFGLAAGAGGRAGLAVLALGAFHYTDYFELSERFVWIASPPVMAVLGVIGVVEIWADAHPDIGEFTELAAWLPKLVAGFLAFAAATGSVDGNLLQLAASGIMGAITAGTVQFVRSEVREVVRDTSEATHPFVDKAYAMGETAVAGTVAGAAFLAPVAIPLLVVVGLGAAWGVRGWLKKRGNHCGDCGGEVHPDAVICPHCRQPTGLG